VYTSDDVRGSVSSIHERARTTQQAPGARSGYRTPRRNSANPSNNAPMISAQTGARSSAPLAPVFSGASGASGDTDTRTRKTRGADLYANLQREYADYAGEARTTITALLRRLDYLLSCKPTPSPALTRSLLHSMQGEALALLGLLDALAPLAPAIPATNTSDAPVPVCADVSALSYSPQEGAPSW
jgi:hypothetical protein